MFNLTAKEILSLKVFKSPLVLNYLLYICMILICENLEKRLLKFFLKIYIYKVQISIISQRK